MKNKIFIKTIQFFLIIFIVLHSTTSLIAQVKLIPKPKQIELKESNFKIDSNTKIVNHHLDVFYVNELVNCVKNEMGIQLLAAKEGKNNCIEFIKISKEQIVKEISSKHLLNADFNMGDEGYILSVKPSEVKIISQTDAGIFYGIQTLKQLIKANRTENTIPSLVIYDSPDIAIRGWQDDISRGPIPTMALLKEQIRKMASYKLNYLTLYIEHVFQFEKYPDIAPKDGISKAQVEELSRFAKQYHVNLIGSYQSFGHMEKTLSKPNYQHLAENSHIISPALPESYEFLQNVYQEIVPVFNGEYFNINCDETFGLGEGKSKDMVDSMGIGGVYLYHINKLNSMLKLFDKRILMWGDIIGNYPQIIDRLPKNITVMAWGYHAAENFEYAITPLSETGLDFWVAPGISCWGNIFPNFNTTEINIYNFIRDGYKHNAKGVLNTSWDDDGFNFFQNNWHGFVWGAENSWNAPSSEYSNEKSNKEREHIYNNFNRNYNAIFYGLKEDLLIDEIVSFSKLHQSEVRDILTNKRFFEPIFPLYLDYIKKGKKEENIRLLNQLDIINESIGTIKSKVRFNHVTIDYLQFAIRQVEFTLRKNILRIDIYHFLNGKSNTSSYALKKNIDKLIIEAKTLQSDYILLWHKENRNWWLSNNIMKYDELIESLNNLKYRCIITIDNELVEKGRKVSIESIFDDLPIYYELNKDAVTQASLKYTAPFFINEDVKISARVIEKEKLYPISTDSTIFHIAIGKLHNLNTKYSLYHPSYDGGGEYALLDGRLGSVDNLRSGKWQGYSGQNIDIELDFSEIQTVNSFSMGFFQNTESWVIFPKKIEIYFKNSANEDYKLLKTILNPISPEEKGNIKYNYKAEFKNFETRYMKVIAHYYGKLPEWHHAGSKNESMIFADEIIIK